MRISSVAFSKVEFLTRGVYANEFQFVPFGIRAFVLSKRKQPALTEQHCKLPVS